MYMYIDTVFRPIRTHQYGSNQCIYVGCMYVWVYNCIYVGCMYVRMYICRMYDMYKCIYAGCMICINVYM